MMSLVSRRRPALRPLLIGGIFATLLALSGCAQKPRLDLSATPPVAAKRPTPLSHHGHDRVDDYYWLNQRENPEVIAYLEAENAYTQAVMSPTQKLQDKLYAEMVGRIKEDDSSLPYLDNGYWYQQRFDKGSEYPVYARRKRQG